MLPALGSPSRSVCPRVFLGVQVGMCRQMDHETQTGVERREFVTRA